VPTKHWVRYALVAAAVSFTAAPAFSDTQFARPFRWEFGAHGGAMVPAGSQGRGLQSGVHFGGSFDYEVDPMFLVGGDVFYSSSNDDLRTQFTGLGVHCVLRPAADFTNLYVQGGIDAYRVSYDPKFPAPRDPRATTRPGGSVGAGFDLASLAGVTVGVAGAYRGVIFGSHNAISYLTLGLYVSVRPGER